jgi:hypothetical protein
MRCDYFRLCYLLERGGFYLDADEWYQGTNCSSLLKIDALRLAPLCYDIDTSSMIPMQVFISDLTESRSRIYYVNNNPIIAPPHHPLVACALERATKTFDVIIEPSGQLASGISAGLIVVLRDAEHLTH